MNHSKFYIKSTWERPDERLLEAFGNLSTAIVSDALGYGVGTLRSSIRPIFECPTFVGPALPVTVAAHDILAVHAATRFARRGDVMMIATNDNSTAAVVGQRTVELLKSKGIVSVVTDGAVRDLDALRDGGFPVYANAISPGIPGKRGGGFIGFPIALGGVAISAGDIVIGDRDGVVSIPLAIAREVLEAVTRAERIEEDLAQSIAMVEREPAYISDALLSENVVYV
ncbi:RraA family protein [Paraburkholderia dipogonis]|uniref:RraA family protein n=1 Tax=Paraburkholderia dipogonis TaxID=1211383 RepID=UPI00141B33EB|nr:RraA family protein [Paraburkholderia dipogonis]